jgi:type II secretory ATPase GspE/PulE/Tfp pilus assembly ATPase PilB-like protein
MDLSVLLAQVPVGEYISVWKTIPLVVVFLIWTRWMTWMDKDAPAAHLPRIENNIGQMSAGILAIVLFLYLGGFWAAFGVMLLVMIVAAAAYLFIRHRKVGLGDLQKQFSDWIRSFARKPSEVKVAEGEVLLFNRAGSPVAAPPAESPERAAYDAVQQVLTDPLRKGAQRIDVTPGEGASTVQFEVDGVSYNSLSLPRGASAGAVSFVKELAGLDLKEKRKPQTGGFRATLDGKRRELQLLTSGSSSGESMTLRTDAKTRHCLTLQQLGLSGTQLEKIQASVAEGKGIVLVSSPHEHGLTSMLYALIRSHDAFLSHIITIERDPDQDLEGITQETLALNATNTEETERVQWVVDREPDVFMINEVRDPKSAAILIKYAAAGHRVYVGTRAANTFEALSNWRKIVGNDKQAMQNLEMIINGRVLRKLCTACKVGYAPDPATLRKMNMDPDRISKLYQARTEPLRDAKGNPLSCEFCHDLRFHGRTGIYEILQVDDEVRQIVTSGGSVNQLKAIFRKQRSKYLQEQALSLVEAGDTSIQEVLRVLKAGNEASGSSSRPASRPPDKGPQNPAVA